MNDEIRLAAHDPGWRAAFTREATALRGLLGVNLVAIHHIGSTAVSGIHAKPVIDILCEVRDLAGVDDAEPQLAASGYMAKGENGIAGRRFLVRRDGNRVRTHHVHAYQTNSPEIERHLAVRDYLRAHPAAAQAYSRLKQSIALQGHETRAAYQAAKSPFLVACQHAAVEWYRKSGSQR